MDLNLSHGYLLAMRALLLVALILSRGGGHLVAQPQWWRGNTHVHSSESDGNTPPAEVVAWYKEWGYHFVVLTDHDAVTPINDLQASLGEANRFLVLQGIEVSDRIDGRPVHLTGLNVGRAIQPTGGISTGDAIRQNARAVEAAGGLPILNHPNGLLRVALTATEIAEGTSALSLFEVCCADYRGGSGRPSTDVLWDSVLTAGRTLWGVAADDAHDFTVDSRHPGTAWIEVKARELTSTALVAALRAGAFYSTTGVSLRDVIVAGDVLCISLPDPTDYGFRTVFITDGGEDVRTDETLRPCAQIPEGNRYVRARVFRSDGAEAWVQPIFLSRQ